MSWTNYLVAQSENPKRGKPPPPSLDAARIFLRLPRREIAYLKFVLESYECMTVVRTEDKKAGEVMLLAAPDFLPDLWAVLECLGKEIPIEVLDVSAGP